MTWLETWNYLDTESREDNCNLYLPAIGLVHIEMSKKMGSNKKMVHVDTAIFPKQPSRNLQNARVKRRDLASETGG